MTSIKVALKILSGLLILMLTVVTRLITGRLLKVGSVNFNLKPWLMNYLRKIIGTFKVPMTYRMAGRKPFDYPIPCIGSGLLLI